MQFVSLQTQTVSGQSYETQYSKDNLRTSNLLILTLQGVQNNGYYSIKCFRNYVWR